MPASALLGLNLPTPGTLINTWGQVLNDQIFALLEQAIAGVETIALTGNYSLTSDNFLPNQSRKAVLAFTAGVGLSAAPTVTVPNKQKVWLVVNNTGFAITFSASGSTTIVPIGRTAFVICDGTVLLKFDPVTDAIAGATTIAAAAAASAAAAATSASNSATFATNSSDSATLAQKWAANPEDVVVSGGLFSALHYRAKASASATAAAASAAAAATFDPSTYYSKTAADARYVPLAGNASLTGNLYDTVVDKGTVSTGTVTFSVAAGSRQRLQVGGALTIALSNKPTTAWGIEIELVNGGAAVITWPVVSWSKGDGTYSTTFSDMGVALLASGTNTVILWANAAGTVFGKAG